MKKIKHPPGLRALVILFLIALWSLGIKAQTANNPVLKWDKEVGCIEYSERGEKEYYNLYEQIESGFCLRVCEYNTVNYSFSANNLIDVEWQVTGGSIQSSSNSGASIQWEANGNGSLSLSITYADNTVEILAVCIEKIKSPKAGFQLDVVDSSQIDFCTNMSISFDNQSNDNGGSAIVNYLWDFGDGITSSLFEPTHAYAHAGQYTVKLTVTNSCNCTSSYKMDVRIMDMREFEISCPSVICEGSVETYSVTDGCGGEWKVEGGHLINNNGTSIDVVWDNVDPEDGFGYVSYRSSCSCPFWTTVKVPVILKNSKIKGPGIVCQDSQGRFTLPQWPTTEFEWMIDGDPNHPMLVHTDQRNEIVINGAAPGDYVLSVRYKNTLINDGKCMGEAEIKFSVAERPQIVTNNNLTNCQNSLMSFNTHNGVSVQWQILLEGNIVHTQYGNTITYNFPNSGSHIVTAGYNGCESDPIVVDVVGAPVITTKIDGHNKVCLNTPYTYTLGENESGYIYVWSVTNGSIIGDNSGSQVDVMFTSPSATLSVVKQAVQNGVTCSSEPLSFNVSQVNLNPIIINNSGQTQFCPSSSATFSLNLGGVVPDHIVWSIKSSTGATNFGSIIEGINSSIATVSFNEISSSAIGNLTVSVTKCGKTASKTFQIKLITPPSLTIGSINSICPSANTVNIPISISPAISSGQIKVFIDGVSQGNYNYTGGSSITIPNNFSNDSNSNISRTITLRLDVCNYTTSTTKNVTVFPKTKVYISPGYSYVVCPSTYAPINLTSTVSTGITASVAFKWYKENVAQPGGNSANFTISGPNPGGIYHLEVTDQNGCTVKSDKIYVTENCGGIPGSGCAVTPNPNAFVDGLWTTCNEITAEAHSDYPWTSISWSGSDHLTLTGGQGTANATFSTTIPGAHTVTARMNYNGCIIIKTYTVKKHYEAKLETAISCNGNNTYNVVLHNNSLSFDINTSSLSFSYSGTGVPAGSSGNSVTLTNVSPGTKVYNLTVSAPGKPDCTISVTLTLDPDPVPNFQVPANNSQYCSDDAVILSIPNYNPSNIYEWVFNGTTFIASGEHSPIQFALTGDYEIRLKVTTPYGCTYETPLANRPTIHINEADFDIGTINPNNADFCANNSIPLSYDEPFGTIAPTDIIWMMGNEEVGTGINYQPTQSGSYWPVLIDGNGCKSYVMVTSPKSYVLRQPPFASISGNTSVCFGENTTLHGITTDNTVEHRWTGGPSIPTAYGTWVAGATNKTLSLNGLSPGTYNYAFHTRDAGDSNCSNSFEVAVVVHPQVVTPSITYNVVNCAPYTIRLTASGPNTGTYTWSNGMTGNMIEVTHGGAYSVTYTETTGCSKTQYIQTPHNPERALWVVPSGCYTVCNAYLLGPLGTYQDYRWEVNSMITQSGSNTFIPKQYINSGGAYQLIVKQQGCVYSSNIPNITVDIKKCPQPACKFKTDFKLVESIPGGFLYYVMIVNPTSSPMAVHLSSYNGYGTFVPAVHILNPGVNNFTVEFHVNGTYYPGANDTFVISAPNCTDEFPTKLAETQWNASAKPASISLSPNPAVETTWVTFDIGSEYQRAESIIVYDLLGIQRYKQKLSDREGEFSLNVSRFTPGTYLISLEADGKRIATEKLIKK